MAATPKPAPQITIPEGHGSPDGHPASTSTATSSAAAAQQLEFISPRRSQKASKVQEGRFGRIFPQLPPFAAPDEKLLALASAMKDPDPTNATGDNPTISAGFTYLGQFIDHDITLDLSPLSALQEDPQKIRNFRTPGLDLDSLYGSGPGPHRFLFAKSNGAGPGPLRLSAKFLLGKTLDSPDQTGTTIPSAGKDNDLPRNANGTAIIGDHRNDENLLVAQTHVALLKFHNKVVDHLAAAGTPPAELFGQASLLVRRHYQWLVLHEFVTLLCGKAVVKDILKNGRHFYKFKTHAFMPWEFSAAAYRLGHSMVRQDYSHNRVFPNDGSGLANTSLELLFTFSGLSGGISGDLTDGTPFRPPVLPTNWIIDWRRFFRLTPPGTVPFNASRKLDPFLVPALHTLPGEAGPAANLAFRNLKRGVLLGLPSGQAVAKQMRKKISFTPLTPAEIASGPDGAVAKAQGFDKETPLWYYILKEAQVRGNGEHLGPVGARLVAEVFIGLLDGDRDSITNNKSWKPTLPANQPGTFTMADLLQFVGDISPIDGVTTV